MALGDQVIAATDAVEGSWVVACRASDVGDGFGTRVELADGRVVAVFRVDGTFYATADRCTHGEASLCEGFVDGRIVECPFHFGTFDVVTGKAMTFPCVTDLATYPVRVEGDQILVGTSPREAGGS